MSPLWTSTDAVRATGGEAFGPAWQATGVSIDSRTLAAGDLFVALKGPNQDGHDHVATSLAAGAAAALLQRRPADLPDAAPLLLVEDSLAGLGCLAVAARQRCRACIIAVTGSVGKTGSKEMLKLALGGESTTHASLGSLNNHWGVPLSLARLPAAARFGVFELGMNHPGEIAPLAEMVRPDIAIITSVEAVHLEFFASVRDIALAKAEIFTGLAPSGLAILPRDNPHYPLLRRRALDAGVTRIQGFGSHIDSSARLLDYAVTADQTLVFALVGDRPISYAVGAPGRPWAINSLAVLLAADAAGIPLEAAAAALSRLAPPKGRGAQQTLPWGAGHLTLIDESYNASPVSVAAALVTLSGLHATKGGRRIAVLGDMLELGDSASVLHRGLAAVVAQSNIDLVFTAGPLMAHLFEALPRQRRGGHAEDAQKLAPLLADRLRRGDLVMVKGSAGSRMGRVIAHLEALAIPLAPVANGH
jgi:UDP-N-acetylmuramoyl-tripeptide--D-alanyl-D-alanine ligase